MSQKSLARWIKGILLGFGIFGMIFCICIIYFGIIPLFGTDIRTDIEDMAYMFTNSVFNRDIFEWELSSINNMSHMFEGSKFNQDIYNWDISGVTNMNQMFANSKFNKDISTWNISGVKYKKDMFNNCPIKEEYKPMFK